MMQLMAAQLGDTAWVVYWVFNIFCFIAIFLAALLGIILVLFQKSNSDGIQGITASSETFFGKNRGRSLRANSKNGRG